MLIQRPLEPSFEFPCVRWQRPLQMFSFFCFVAPFSSDVRNTGFRVCSLGFRGLYPSLRSAATSNIFDNRTHKHQYPHGRVKHQCSSDIDTTVECKGPSVQQKPTEFNSTAPLRWWLVSIDIVQALLPLHLDVMEPLTTHPEGFRFEFY